jgi:hypothetical protein
MTERPFRARMQIALYTVAFLGTTLAGFALLQHILIPRCLFGEVVRRDVPIPPASAGPQEVVNAYIEAILGKDEQTVRAVNAPETDFDNVFNGDFAQSFGVRYVKDRWRVTGFGSG